MARGHHKLSATHDAGDVAAPRFLETGHHSTLALRNFQPFSYNTEARVYILNLFLQNFYLNYLLSFYPDLLKASTTMTSTVHVKNIAKATDEQEVRNFFSFW